MKMSKHKDTEKLEQEVSPWLKKRGIPQENYRKLPFNYKILLHDLVCTQAYPSSPLQRRDLYRRLCSPGVIAGRESIDPVDTMTDEDLRTFFSPLTPSQGRLLDDWGC